MKRFFGILSIGLVLFVAAAIAQEWDYFSSAWFGRPEAPETATQEDGETQALGTVREALALMAHLYASGGDPRFAERLRLAPELLDEIQRDIEYLAKNRRVQNPRLQRLELLGADPAGKGQLVLRTREFWIHRTFWSNGSGESDPPRSVILYARYQLVQENSGWSIFGWEFDRPETE